MHLEWGQLYDHGPGPHACDCGGPAIPEKREEDLDIDPTRQNSQCTSNRQVEHRVTTGAAPGKIGCVRRASLLIKFSADVLHSNASRRKSSRTSNVKAVFGFLNVAGKSLDRSNWMCLSGALGHLHHWTDHLKIPVDAITTIHSLQHNIHDIDVNNMMIKCRIRRITDVRRT